jgi:recyclin-1
MGPISEQGGFQLICDLNAFYDWSSKLQSESLKKKYQNLKELGNIYIMDAKGLKPYLQEHQRYSEMRVEEVLEFVQVRSDYKKIAKVIESENCTIS